MDFFHWRKHYGLHFGLYCMNYGKCILTRSNGLKLKYLNDGLVILETLSVFFFFYLIDRLETWIN